MNYYLEVLKKYAVFSGRASRAEYWYFALFSSIIATVLGIIGAMVIGEHGMIFWMVYALAVFIPSLAVSVRRMHDIGKNGWTILIWLIPLIGGIWLFVLTVLDSNPGENKYGPNPKGVATASVTTQSQNI